MLARSPLSVSDFTHATGRVPPYCTSQSYRQTSTWSHHLSLRVGNNPYFLSVCNNFSQNDGRTYISNMKIFLNRLGVCQSGISTRSASWWDKCVSPVSAAFRLYAHECFSTSSPYRTRTRNSRIYKRRYSLNFSNILQSASDKS